MSELLKRNYKYWEPLVSQSGVSMHFWGICCVSGKQYGQVVGQRFRVTMAVLDPKSFCMEDSERIVLLIVIRDGIEYLLCVLKHGEIHQVNLNLIFDKGENVVFLIRGYGKVCLSGYQLTDSGDDVLNDENGYLCPLVEIKPRRPGPIRGYRAIEEEEEIKSKGKKDKVSGSPMETKSETVTSKDKKKAKAEKKAMMEDKNSARGFWNLFVNQRAEVDDDDDDDDESDSDFSVNDEEIESDSDEEDTSEDDMDEEEVDDEKEMIQNSQGSLKRKHGKMLRSQKRSKNDSFKHSTSVQNSDDIICMDNNESDSDSDGSPKRKHGKMLRSQKRSKNDSFNPSTSVQNSDDIICMDNNEAGSDSDDMMNSSIGNTPMPKKQVNNEADSSEKKKSKKKKKRLSEVSNISEKSVNIKNEQKLSSPTAKSTPNKQKSENKSKHPVETLEGGVEIQDVVVGRGPVATKGKMVHVFYVGRYEDKTIFDSRVPGKKPFSFKLGAEQVIKGWDVGLQGMRVGGQRKLKVPPNMGYGNTRNVGIPPNSTLYFTVELQAVS